MVIIPKEFNKATYQWVETQIRRAKDLTSTDKIVMLELCFYVNSMFHHDNIDYCYPTFKQLEEDLNISSSTLTNCLNNLSNLGYISVEKQSKKNLYRILDNNLTTSKIEVKKDSIENRSDDKNKSVRKSKCYQFENRSVISSKIATMRNSENANPESEATQNSEPCINSYIDSNINNTLSKDNLCSTIEDDENFIYNEEYLRTIINELSELSKIPINKIEQAISMVYKNKIKILAIEYNIFYILKHKYTSAVYTQSNAYAMLNSSLSHILEWNLSEFYEWKKQRDDYLIDSELERVKRKEKDKYKELSEKAKNECMIAMKDKIDLSNEENRQLNELLYKMGKESYLRTYIATELKKKGKIRYS